MSIPLEWLWRSSWQAAVVAALVLATRAACGRALGPRWRLALWALVLVRLVMPAAPTSRYSLFGAGEWMRGMRGMLASRGPSPSATPRDPSATKVEVRYGGIEGLSASPEADRSIDTARLPPVARPTELILLAIWLVVAAGLGVRLVVGNVVFMRQLRRAGRGANDGLIDLLERCRWQMGMHRSPTLLITDAVDAPAVAGLWRPCILLPAALADELPARQVRLILLHELSHVKCRDIAVDWVWALACAVHWFNPAVWLARSRYRVDRELARDAMVLSVTGAAAAEGYGRTILRLVQVARPLRLCPGLVGMADGRAELRRRIAMIARFDKRRHRFPLLGIVLFTLVGSIVLTDSRGEGPPSSPAPSPAPTAAPAPGLAPATPPAPTPTAAPAPAAAPGLAPAREQRIPSQETPKNGDARDAQVQAKLDRAVPEVNFAAVPFTDVIEFLRDVSETNIFVNWKALEAAGIDRQTPVTARLRDVKFSKVLRTILTDVGGGNVKLEYAIDEGVITVSTIDDLVRDVVTRVYDVRDLLLTGLPDGNSDALATPAGQPAASQPADLTGAIVGLIQDTVAVDSWRDKGGKVGSIRELSGQLIITQTPENHEQIVRVLDQLRENRGLQINVEARLFWLDHVMAKLPIELRKRIQSLNAPNRDAGARTAQLTAEESDLLWRALSDQTQATTLTAPRLTLFDGQNAFVKYTTQNAYVASFSARKKPDGSAEYEPQVAVVESGLMLEVRATASQDRKRVTLIVHPKLTRLDAIDNSPAPGLPADSGAMVQRPIVRVRQMRTTVTCDDGSAVLLGGFDELVEREVANRNGKADPSTQPLGEPAVNKLMQGNEQQLFLIVRPTLIIQPNPVRPAAGGDMDTPRKP